MTTNDIAQIAKAMREAAEGAASQDWDGMFAPSSSVNKDMTFGRLKWPVCVLSQVDGYPEPGVGLIADAYSPAAQSHIAASNPANVIAVLDRLAAVERERDQSREFWRREYDKLSKAHATYSGLLKRAVAWMERFATVNDVELLAEIEAATKGKEKWTTT